MRPLSLSILLLINHLGGWFGGIEIEKLAKVNVLNYVCNLFIDGSIPLLDVCACMQMDSSGKRLLNQVQCSCSASYSV